MATMTIKDAYKLGFAEKLAELGVSPGELQAAWFRKEATGSFLRDVLDRLGDISAKTVGLGLVAPWALGTLAGYSFGGGAQTSEADIDYLRQKSLADEYKYAIERMRRQRERKKLEAEGAMQLPKAAMVEPETGAERVRAAIRSAYPGYTADVRKLHGPALPTKGLFGPWFRRIHGMSEKSPYVTHGPGAKEAAVPGTPMSAAASQVPGMPEQRPPVTTPGNVSQNIQNVQSVLMQPRPKQPMPKTMPNIGGRDSLKTSLRRKGIAVA